MLSVLLLLLMLLMLLVSLLLQHLLLVLMLSASLVLLIGIVDIVVIVVGVAAAVAAVNIVDAVNAIGVVNCCCPVVVVDGVVAVIVVGVAATVVVVVVILICFFFGHGRVEASHRSATKTPSKTFGSTFLRLLERLRFVSLEARNRNLDNCCCMDSISRNIPALVIITLENLFLDRALSILVMAPSHCSTIKQIYHILFIDV